MSKKFNKEFESQISDNELPLMIHYAELKETKENQSSLESNMEVAKHSSAIIKRYKTTRFRPVNKFYKPISRTLDA